MKSVKHYSWFQVAEGCSVASCVVGSIASVVYQQLAYASAPLAVALSLSWINRSKMLQEVRQHNKNTVSEMHQAIQSLQKQVQKLPNQTTDIEPIRKSLFQLHQTTQFLIEQFNNRPETQVVEQLKMGFIEMTNHVNDLSISFDNFSTPTEINITDIEGAIAHLNSQLEALGKQVNAKPEAKEIDKLNQALSDIQSATEVQIKTLKAQLQAFDFNQVNNNIAKLQSQIHLIKEQQEITPQFDPHSLEERFIEFEKKNLTTYKDHIARLLSAIQQLQADKTATEAAIAKITEHLQTLSLRLDNLPISSSPVDLSEIEKSITKLSNHLNSLAQKFVSRSEPTAIQRLALIVNQLQEHINTLPPSSETTLHDNEKLIADIHERLALLESLHLAAIPEQLTQLQTDLKLAHKQLDHQRLAQSSLTELTSAQMEGLKQEVEKLRFQTVSNLTSKMTQLQQQQEVVLDQLSSKHQYLEGSIADLHEQNQMLREDIDKYYTEMSQTTVLLDKHNIKQQLETVQQIINRLDQKNTSSQNLEVLQQQITHLQKLLNEYVKTEYLDNVLLDLCEVFSKQIDSVVDIRFAELKKNAEFSNQNLESTQVEVKTAS